MLKALTAAECVVRLEYFSKDSMIGRMKLADFKIKGTTLSGHPTRTTLGNSLKVLSYAKYILANSYIPDNQYKIFVSGDDVIMFLERNHEPHFTKKFGTYYINGDYLGVDVHEPV